MIKAKWIRVLLQALHAVHVRPIYGNCLALYSHEGSHCDAQRCFDVVVDQFAHLGIKPDLIGYGDASKMISYDRGVVKLRKKGWVGIRSVDIKASRAFGGFTTGWFASSSIGPELGILTFCFSSDLADYDSRYMISVAEILSQHFEFDYGFSYRRRLERGAEIYAFGMIAGLRRDKSAEREKLTIAKWFNANGFFKERGDSRSYHFRDVYEMNFLSPVHLNQMVNGMLMKDWVNAGPERGKLVTMVGERMIWIVRKEDIKAVREELIRNNLLVAFRPDIPPLELEPLAGV